MENSLQLPRLDVLIYAHDGRGLGHASRSIAIGLALRRLVPDLRVLFVSGCSFSQELIGEGELDWLKLPSYETEVVKGKSKGMKGKSGFEDAEIGRIRAEQIKSIVLLYRPRLVLADHSPQGKHKELVPALKVSAEIDTKWILGVRGVIGSVNQTVAELPASVFASYYSGLLWYGDRLVLGEEHLRLLKKVYQSEPVECGYVSRLGEVIKGSKKKKEVGGVISIPWLGEHSSKYLLTVADLLKRLDEKYGQWKMFIDLADKLIDEELKNRLQTLSNCTVEKPGKTYNKTLAKAKIAIIYGGYNSLVDVMYFGIPALVCMRSMRDSEQQLHLECLQASVPNKFYIYEEDTVTTDELESMILQASEQSSIGPIAPVNLKGSESAAHQLLSHLGY